MQQQLLYGVAVVPAVIGLTQIAKTAGLPTQFAPVIAVILGILAGLAEMYGAQWPIIQTIVVGVGLGLSSVGLYSAGSTAYTHVSNRNSTTGTPPTSTGTNGPTLVPTPIPPQDTTKTP